MKLQIIDFICSILGFILIFPFALLFILLIKLVEVPRDEAV